jgi:dUTP pyrophosphatase
LLSSRAYDAFISEENMSNSSVAYFTKIHEDAIIPTIANKGSVGFDLYCLEDFTLYPFNLSKIRTGIVSCPPVGYHFELLLRSSIAAKNPGVILANSIGLIDPNYIGAEDELLVLLWNCHPLNEYTFEKGSRIAQLVLRENLVSNIVERPLEDLRDVISRKGFGSTGK